LSAGDQIGRLRIKEETIKIQRNSKIEKITLESQRENKWRKNLRIH